MNSYLVWKTDDNAVLRKSKMWIQQVEENGITFTESTERILIMSAEKDEDRLVVEGGSIIFKDPFYYLFFSSSGYNNPKYHVNVARSTKVVIVKKLS